MPADTEVLYHVMVGPGVLTFVKEMGEHFGPRRPQIFGFVDSVEGVDIASPGLEFLEGTYFWEAFPRYAAASTPAHVRLYRERVGINDSGASLTDPKDVSTASHMFGCWETLFVIKRAVEQSGYKRPGADYKAFIETLEGFQTFPEGIEHPQGPKRFVGRIHQAFGQQVISKVEKRQLQLVHRTAIEDSMYEPEARLYEAAALGPGLIAAGPDGGARSVPTLGAPGAPMSLGPHLFLALLEGTVGALVLALTALGLSLVFGVMRIVNVAHGEFFMLGAVVTWYVATTTGSFLLALAAAPAVVGAVAVLADRLVLRRIGYEPESTIVATIGLLYSSSSWS